MTDREKLIAMVKRAITDWEHGDVSERIADHLIKNGVTIPVECSKCEHYSPDGSFCWWWGGVRNRDHFCGDGERKGNATN